MRKTVQSWLAQSVEPNTARGIHVQAAVQRKVDGFMLDLVLVTPSGGGHEQLLATRCETLAGVVALKVALAADPGAWFRAMESVGDAAHVPHWGLRLATGVGPGVLPGVGPTLELTGTLRLSRVAMELGAGYGLPNRARYLGRPSIGADLDLLYATARVCALPDMGAVEFPLCGGADLGLMRATGFGVPVVFTSTQPYAALVVGPGLRWPVTQRFAAWFGLEALVSLLQPSYHVRNLGPLYTPETIGARVQLGTELHFE